MRLEDKRRKERKEPIPFQNISLIRYIFIYLIQRILLSFLKSEEHIMVLGEEDEGKMKRIQEMKDKGGILI